MLYFHPTNGRGNFFFFLKLNLEVFVLRVGILLGNGSIKFEENFFFPQMDCFKSLMTRTFFDPFFCFTLVKMKSAKSLDNCQQGEKVF